jgi:hypothetical protein
VVFLSPSKANAGTAHPRFLPAPFQFIIHTASYLWTLCCLAADGAVKQYVFLTKVSVPLSLEVTVQECNYRCAFWEDCTLKCWYGEQVGTSQLLKTITDDNYYMQMLVFVLPLALSSECVR